MYSTSFPLGKAWLGLNILPFREGLGRPQASWLGPLLPFDILVYLPQQHELIAVGTDRTIVVQSEG